MQTVTPQNNSLPQKIELFKLFSTHDYFVVFSTLALISFESIYVGLAILVMPFLMFARQAIILKKPPESTVRIIREEFPESKKVIFRYSFQEDTQALSIPFFKLIVLSKTDMDDLESKSGMGWLHAKGVVAHELAHFTTFDNLFNVWTKQIKISLYILSFIFLMFATVVAIIPNWESFFEWLPQNISIFFWIAMVPLSLLYLAETIKILSESEHVFFFRNKKILFLGLIFLLIDYRVFLFGAALNVLLVTLQKVFSFFGWEKPETLRWSKIIYLIVIIFIAVIFFIISFNLFTISGATGWRTLADSYVVDWLVTAIVCFFIATVLRNASYRREHLADLRAATHREGPLKSFLNFQLKISSNKDTATHPSFSKRYHILTQPLEHHNLNSLKISLQLVLLVFLHIKLFSGGQNFRQNFFCILSVLIFSSLITYVLSVLISKHRNEAVCKKIATHYLFGLALGLLLCIVYVYLTNNSSFLFPWDHYKREMSKPDAIIKDYFFWVVIWSIISSFLVFLFRIKSNSGISFSSFVTPFAIIIGFCIYTQTSITAPFKLLLFTISPDHYLRIMPDNTERQEKELQASIDILERDLRNINRNIVEHVYNQNESIAAPEEYRTIDWPPREPFLMSKPIISEMDIKVQRSIKDAILHWEKVSGKNFLSDHPSMKKFKDDKEGNSDLVMFPPLPSKNNNVLAYNPKGVYFDDLCCFQRIIWSPVEALCWYKNDNAAFPKQIVCGEDYTIWMTRLYHGHIIDGRLSPYYYAKNQEYQFYYKQRNQKKSAEYRDRLAKNQREKEIFDAYAGKDMLRERMNILNRIAEFKSRIKDLKYGNTRS